MKLGEEGWGRGGVGGAVGGQQVLGAKSPWTSQQLKEARSRVAQLVLFKRGFNVCKYGLIRSLCNHPSASDPPLQSRRQFV